MKSNALLLLEKRKQTAPELTPTERQNLFQTLEQLRREFRIVVKNEIMAKQVEMAYKIFCHFERLQPITPDELEAHPKLAIFKDRMFDFLTIVLDAPSARSIHWLMAKSEKRRQLFPKSEYIPGHAPILTTLPRPEDAISKGQMRWRRFAEAMLASKFEKQKVLTNAVEERELDKIRKIIKFTPEERARYRVFIYEGHFCKANPEKPQQFNFVSTSSMVSHKKIGFAAFVINLCGEISIFNHYEGVIRHSTFNDGAAVMAAGEIIIDNGKLSLLTDHSGHYEPDLLNMYHLLHYLQKKGVVISEEVLVHLMFPIDEALKIKLIAFLPKDAISRHVYRAVDIMGLTEDLILAYEPFDSDDEEEEEKANAFSEPKEAPSSNQFMNKIKTLSPMLIQGKFSRLNLSAGDSKTDSDSNPNLGYLHQQPNR
jgi:hypothetical protein